MLRNSRAGCQSATRVILCESACHTQWDSGSKLHNVTKKLLEQNPRETGPQITTHSISTHKCTARTRECFIFIICVLEKTAALE